jgi:hypothetical protein
LDSAVTAVRSASRRDRGGSSGTLQLGQLAFSGYGPVFFVCAFDAVFELVPVVEKLLDHFVGAAGLTSRKLTISPTWNLCGGWHRPARSSWRDAATGRVTPPDLSLKLPLTSCTSVILDSSLQFVLGLAPEDRLRD